MNRKHWIIAGFLILTFACFGCMPNTSGTALHYNLYGSWRNMI